MSLTSGSRSGMTLRNFSFPKHVSVLPYLLSEDDARVCLRKSSARKAGGVEGINMHAVSWLPESLFQQSIQLVRAVYLADWLVVQLGLHAFAFEDLVPPCSSKLRGDSNGGSFGFGGVDRLGVRRPRGRRRVWEAPDWLQVLAEQAELRPRQGSATGPGVQGAQGLAMPLARIGVHGVVLNH
eukprot:1363831-Amphidinium_carterae.2